MDISHYGFTAIKVKWCKSLLRTINKQNLAEYLTFKGRLPMIRLNEFLSVRLEGCQAGSDLEIYCSLEVEQEASATSSSLAADIWQNCFPWAEEQDFPRSYLYVQSCFQSSFKRERSSLIFRVYSPASCHPSPPVHSGLLAYCMLPTLTLTQCGTLSHSY